jgi:cytochrome P450 family 6
MTIGLDIILHGLLRCVPGMRFGLMQTKVGLVSLLSKYQFCLSEKMPVPLIFNVKSSVLSPVCGMWLQIKKRVK